MSTKRIAPCWGTWARLAVLWVAAPPLALAQGLEKLTHWEEGRSMRVGSNVWIENDRYDGQNNKDRPDRIEPGETYVMADLEGPGVITHIYLSFLQEPHHWVTDGAADPQEMLLRIYWDGRDKPDVETPLGDFFANCFGRQMTDGDNPLWHSRPRLCWAICTAEGGCATGQIGSCDSPGGRAGGFRIGS